MIMTIRPFTLDEFEAAFALWQTAGLQLYPHEDELKRFENMLSLNPDLCLALIDESKTIVGTILGAFDGRTASIHRLAVKPELQKQGWGSYLVKQLEIALKERGIKKLSAQIHISNTQVVPFYEKHGFKEMDYVKTYFKDL